MESRRGYEFPGFIRQAVLRRAGNRCEFPAGCASPNNRRVDHFTSIKLGKLMGVPKETLRSMDNAQTLCNPHDKEKTEQERRVIWQYEQGTYIRNRGNQR